LSKFHFVIPNRAESPVRNLLFDGQTADSSRDKAALRNDNFQTDPLLDGDSSSPAQHARDFLLYLWKFSLVTRVTLSPVTLRLHNDSARWFADQELI